MIWRWLRRGGRAAPLDEALWRRLRRRSRLLRALDADAAALLRERAGAFLADKAITGAAGFEPSPLRQGLIAALCCLPALRLPADSLDGWHEVIVYPGQFRVRRHQHDDDTGVAHEWDDDLAGEAWDRGPIVLSWADVLADLRYPEPGFNVIVHEIAHKLDGGDGALNGTPLLRDATMRREWISAFQQAVDDLNTRLDRGEAAPIDDYAAESPDEFFAVASEYHYTAPGELAAAYPAVAALLARYYGPAPRPPRD